MPRAQQSICLSLRDLVLPAFGTLVEEEEEEIQEKLVKVLDHAQLFSTGKKKKSTPITIKSSQVTVFFIRLF